MTGIHSWSSRNCMPPMPRWYVNKYNENTKSSANHAVANFLIRLGWSFFMSARMRVAPTAGRQVLKERMLGLVIALWLVYRFGVRIFRVESGAGAPIGPSTIAGA